MDARPRWRHIPCMPITNTPRPLTARDAEKRILDLAAGTTTARNERAIVDTLAALPLAERGECLRLLEGRNSHHGLDHILRDDIDDVSLRNEAMRLIGEARPFMASPGRVTVSDIDDTVKPGKDHHQRRGLPGCCSVVCRTRRRQRRHRCPW